MAIAIVVGVWVAAFAGLGTNKKPGQLLNSPEALVSFRSHCEGLQDFVNKLPNASTATTPQERGATLVLANKKVTELVSQLKTVAVTDSRDNEAVTAWLNDWRLYLEAREIYTVRLLQGDDIEFTLPGTNGKAITSEMNLFASVNQIDDCKSPSDL